MEQPEENSNSKEVEKYILSTMSQAAQVRSNIKDTDSKMQNIIDISENILPLVQYMNPAQVEQVGILYNEANNHTINILRSLKDVSSSSDSAAGTITTTASAISLEFENDIYLIDTEKQSVQAKLENLDRIIWRQDLKKKVVELLHIFQLDIPSTGKQSTLQLFETAHKTYETPILETNAAITSLLPIRESVSLALNELLRRRPRQEPSGSGDRNKILAIGAQLKKDIISDIVVQEWADLWHEISDKDLSSSKERAITREEWGRKLNRATSFFYSFLTGLDSSKLR